MLDDRQQFRRRHGQDRQRVVEAERVLDVDLRDLAVFAEQAAERWDSLARGGVEAADISADAAAVFQRHHDVRVEGFGHGQVGVGRQVAEVGFLGADVAACAVEEHVGPAEDVAQRRLNHGCNGIDDVLYGLVRRAA